MTELDLAVELDLCGPEVILVVAPYKQELDLKNTLEEKICSSTEKHVQWCEFGDAPLNNTVHSQMKDSCLINDTCIDDGKIESKTASHAVFATDDTCIDDGKIESKTASHAVFATDEIIDSNEKDQSSKIDVDSDDVSIQPNKESNNGSHTISAEKNMLAEFHSANTSEEHDVALALLRVGNSAEHKAFPATPHNEQRYNCIQDKNKDFLEKGCHRGRRVEEEDKHQSASSSEESLADSSASRTSNSSIENTEKEWDDDENPWLGCICGETHKKPIKVFWLQCDSCDAWYNCAPRCIGFTKEEAEERNSWHCPDCSSVVTESSSEEKECNPTKKETPLQIADDSDDRECDVKEKPIFSVGTIVEVEDRTW